MEGLTCHGDSLTRTAAGPAGSGGLQELFQRPLVRLAMKDTDQKAGKNMMRFVGTIFAIALALAAVYFFVLTPEQPKAAVVAGTHSTVIMLTSG